MRLGDFLAEAGRGEFRYGERDCCLWLADWILDQRGVDPAGHLRGRYRTELGCRRLLRRHGGVLAVVTECAAIAGLDATSAPTSGDVGVVEMVTTWGVHPVGAIFDGRRWATLMPHGLVALPVCALATWKV